MNGRAHYELAETLVKEATDLILGKGLETDGTGSQPTHSDYRQASSAMAALAQVHATLALARATSGERLE